jgi:uncharacterized protein involved in exopolysaccharide biosynthesis
VNAAAGDHIGGDQRPERPALTLRDLTASLFRQSRVALGCFVFGAAAVIAAALVAPTVYQAELKILVKRDRIDSLITGSESGSAARLDVSEPELFSEVELLRGTDLLEAVAIATSLPERVSKRATADQRPQDVAQAVAALRDNLTVAPIRKTWMIDVTYANSDPQFAKELLDTLSRLYLEKHLALRRPPGAHQFFSDQLERAAAELSAAHAQLQVFGERRRVVSAATQREAVLQKLAEFEALEHQARAELAETGRRVTALGLERARTPARRASQQRTTDSAGIIQDIQARILNLEIKRSELLQKFTPQYRAVVDVGRQIEQARAALEQARNAPVREETVAENPTVQWLDNEIARARTEREALETRAESIAETVAQYRARAQSLDADDAEQQDLLRAVKFAEDQYLLYQRKQEEARISDALDRTRIANVAIAQAPTVPSEPVRSRRLLWMLIGLFVAVLLSVGAALAADALSQAIRTPDELQLALDAPMLAWAPAAPRWRPAAR